MKSTGGGDAELDENDEKMGLLILLRLRGIRRWWGAHNICSSQTRAETRLLTMKVWHCAIGKRE